MNFIKKHKNLVIEIIIFCLVLLVAFLSRRLLSNTENSAIYGDRLKEVKVEVNEKSIKSKIEESLKDQIDSASVRKQGRIIEITLIVKKDINQDTAKEAGNKVLESIGEKQIKTYDIQIFINKDSEDATFPIIGYKNHAGESISWTRNR